MKISNIKINRCSQSGLYCMANDKNRIKYTCEGSFDVSIRFFERNNVYDIIPKNMSKDDDIFEITSLSVDDAGNKICYGRGNYTAKFKLKFYVDSICFNNIGKNACEFCFMLEAKYNDGIQSQCTSQNITIQNPSTYCEKKESCNICHIKPVDFEYSEDTMFNNSQILATITINSDTNNITPVLNEVKYGEVSLQGCRIGEGANNIYPLYFDINELGYPKENIFVAIDLNCGVNNHTITETLPYNVSSYFNKMDAVLSRIDNLGNRDYVPLSDGTEFSLYDIHLDDGDAIIHDEVVINNLAQDTRIPQTGLRIKNIRTEITAVSNDIERIIGDISYLNTHDVNEYILNIHNGNRHAIPIDFDFGRIQNVKVVNGLRQIEVSISVEFDYREDRFCSNNDKNNDIFPIATNEYTLKDSQWRTFGFTLKTTIYGQEPKEWYSVDFGTSAVVAFKTNYHDVPPIFDIINLNEIKNRLIYEMYPNEADKRRDLHQPGGMIASTLYLNPAGSDDANSFRNKKIWFSPSRGMVNQLYQLPCLKYMVGNKDIPNIELSEEERRTLPTQIEEIMSITYNQLCDYYLGEQNIQSLVFTVPNTFTPLHIANIRKVLIKQVPTLIEEYLEFISESDAVLCLYLSNRDRILPQNMRQRTSEHILVYDMGAGTLDLTYAECRYENNNHNVSNVVIKGRMGINKAGNYIDYLLGEIIVDLLVNTYQIDKDSPKIIALNGILTTSPTDGIDYGQRRMFKDYLCNKVKTILNEDDNTPLPKLDDIAGYQIGYHTYDELAKITIGEIKEHKLFKDYIRSCTIEVMQDFARLYGSNTTGVGPRLRLDYIFLSGRTISINAIRDSLMKITREIGFNDLNRRIEIIRNDNGQDNIGNKLAVAEGALNYVKLNRFTSNFNINKKNVYGNYGILVDGVNTEWMRLIDHRTVSDEDNRLVRDIQVNCHNIGKIILCHTYKDNPTQDIKDNNYDSTTILHSYTVPIGITQQINLMNIRLEIDENSNISYFIGPNQIPLQPHDDYGNLSLRKSLWPVVYR